MSTSHSLQNTVEKPVRINPDVQRAHDKPTGVVALESTLIGHGLPYPENLPVARAMEEAVRDEGSIPATVAILGGEPVIGLDEAQLEYLARAQGVRKCSRRDLPIAVAMRSAAAASSMLKRSWKNDSATRPGSANSHLAPRVVERG